MLDSVRSASPATRLLFRFRDTKQTAGLAYEESQRQGQHTAIDPILYAGMWPSTVEICSALGSGEYPNTNADDYTKFIAFHKCFRAKKTDEAGDMAFAVLHLHHPVPDPRFALDSITKYFRCVSLEERRKRLPRDPVAVHALRRLFEKTVGVMREAKAKEDARWVHELASDLFPLVSVPMRPKGRRLDSPYFRDKRQI